LKHEEYTWIQAGALHLMGGKKMAITPMGKTVSVNGNTGRQMAEAEWQRGTAKYCTKMPKYRAVMPKYRAR
jgi:hypothetical protein